MGLVWLGNQLVVSRAFPLEHVFDVTDVAKCTCAFEGVISVGMVGWFEPFDCMETLGEIGIAREFDRAVEIDVGGQNISRRRCKEGLSLGRFGRRDMHRQ